MPGHIAHRKTEGYLGENWRIIKIWQNFQGRIAHGMEYFAEHGYRRALKFVLKYRYAAWATATGVIIGQINNQQLKFDVSSEMLLTLCLSYCW